MTLPASNIETDPTSVRFGLPNNEISFSQIETEFGQASERRVGQYRVSQVYGAFDSSNAGITPAISSVGMSFPLSTNAGLNADQDIPSTGQIKFSDFYSGQRTVLVDAYSVDDSNASMMAFGENNTYYQNYTMNAKTSWNSGNRVRVGEEHIPGTPSADASNTTVIVYVNKFLTGTKPTSAMQATDGLSREYVAFKTGSWPASTNLKVIVGDKGVIMGGGGNGGAGGNGTNAGAPGHQATSGFGANNDVHVTVKNGGKIEKGYGGGGGGGGYYASSKGWFLGWGGYSTTQKGGGGGGGAGLHVHGVSSGGTGSNPGASGGTGPNSGGAGGGASGGNSDAGDGGDGGDRNGLAQNGDSGSAGGGLRGSNGHAFRRTSGSTITLVKEAGSVVPNDSMSNVGPVRLDN